VLTQPGPSLTDLALGLLTLALLPAVRRPGVNRYWRATVWCAAVAALAGAVHHGFIVRSERWAGPSWALVSVIVVVTISFTLAATVADLLTPRQARVFAVVRVVSLASYAALALTGHYGVTTILACESVTMAAVVILWILALRRGDPRARSMVIAFVVSAAAGVMRAVPGSVTRVVGLDPVSLYHLAQMPAMVTLCLALHHRAAKGRTGDLGDRGGRGGSAATAAGHQPAVAR
jgi:Family of unknown function (DUF6962)